MADISLVLKPDFAAAQKSLQEVAASSTAAAERFQRLNDKMKDKSADDFIAKQRAMQAALTATQGETAGAQKAYDNYRKEIERLIQNGLDPQSEYIQRLSTEMQALQRDTEHLKQANKDFARDAKEGQEIIAGFAMAAAAAAAGVIALVASYTEGTYAGKLLEDSMANLKGKVGELVEPLVDKIVPAIADLVNGVADFVSGSHEAQGELEILAGLAITAGAAFTAFFIAVNQAKILAAVSTAIQGVTTAVHGMNAAMAANPIGLVIVAAIALVGVIITLVKNWDTVKLKVQEFADNAQAQLAETAARMELNFSVAINNVKQFFLSLASVISDALLSSISDLLDALSAIPFIGDHFKSAAGAVDGFNKSVQESVAASQRESREAEAAARRRLQEIAAEKQARKDAADQAKRDAEELYERNKAAWEAEQEAANAKAAAASKAPAAAAVPAKAPAASPAESGGIPDDYGQLWFAEELEFQEAYQAMLDKEQADAQAARDKEQAAKDKARADEKAKELAHQKDMYNIRREAFNAASSLIGSLGELMADDTDSKKAFDQNKAISAATAGVNTALAFTQALTDPSQPITALRVATAAAVLAAGVVQQKKILSATYRSASSAAAPSISIPSGQTSTASSAAQTSPQAAGAGSASGQTIVVQMDSRVLYSSVNQGVRDGLIKEVNNVRAVQ